VLRFSLGDLRFDSEYLEQIKSVSSETLERLAREYLTPERMSLVLLQPEKEKAAKLDGLKSVFAGLASAPVRAAKKKSPKARGEPEILTTASGLQVAYLERPGSPVYSLYASAYGGSRSELGLGEKYWGASHLLSQTWAKGTPDLNSKQLSAIIEGSAASLDGFSGRNTIGLQSTALLRDWDRLSGLFQEVLLSPAFAEDELAHAKRVTSDQIRSIPNHSSQVCSRLFMENLFDSHPYAKSTLGTEEQVERIAAADLRDLHARFVTPSNMSLSVVGGVSRSQFEDFLGTLEEKLSKRTSGFKQEPLPPPPALPGPRYASARFDREQTHILVGGLGLSMFQPERHALRILQNILGGQSGRLFIELREKRSMAYSVAPTSMEGLETGYVGTYIACAPEKKDEAIAEIRRVIETLVKKGPTRAEMERAKNYTLGQRAMDLQSTWSLAAGYGLELLYRGKISPESEVRKTVLSVTESQVRKVAEKLLLKAPQLTVTVA
jgi:zinc protease